MVDDACGEKKRRGEPQPKPQEPDLGENIFRMSLKDRKAHSCAYRYENINF